MYHKVKMVKALPDFVLSVEFEEGTTMLYDVKELFDRFPAFTALNVDEQLFQEVEVDRGGYGIIWNDDLDLSSEELWNNGKSI